MTLVNGGPDLNFIEHIPCYKIIWMMALHLACIYLSSFSHVSLYHCSGTTSYNFRLQQHESEELGLLPARKYEYLVLVSGILLVCYKMKGAQSAALQKATCVHFLNSNILNHMFRSVLTSWTCFPYSRSVPIPSVTFDTKCWRHGSAIHPMRRVQNSPLHCAPSTPVDAEKIVEQPLCRSVWSVFVSLSKVVGDSRWVLTQSCNNCIEGIQKMKVQVPFVEL